MRRYRLPTRHRRHRSDRLQCARRSGLSTVELLVVVAIVGVLMAIAFAIFGKVRALIQSWS